MPVAVAVAVSVPVSVSDASSSINDDSTAISDTFNTGFTYVSSYTPLSKKQCFYFSISVNNFLDITWS